MEIVAPQIFSPWLNNLAIAIMILLIGFMAGKLISMILYKLLKEIQLDKTVNKYINQKFYVSRYISSIVSVTIYIITFFLALDKLRLTTAFIFIISIIALIIFIGTLILGLGGFFPNLYAWIMIMQEGKIKSGNKIKLKTLSGKITRIGVFRSWIEKSGENFVVQNSVLYKEGKKV